MCHSRAFSCFRLLVQMKYIIVNGTYDKCNYINGSGFESSFYVTSNKIFPLKASGKSHTLECGSHGSVFTGMMFTVVSFHFGQK